MVEEIKSNNYKCSISTLHPSNGSTYTLTNLNRVSKPSNAIQHQFSHKRTQVSLIMGNWPSVEPHLKANKEIMWDNLIKIGIVSNNNPRL